MTTTTDAGLEWISDRTIGNVSDLLDTIAVGTGTGSEATTSTSLANEQHRADTTDSDVRFVETGNAAEYEAIITVTGGDEVPDGTVITEIGVIAGGVDTGGTDTLVFVDEFTGVTVDQGHSEEFTVPISIIR